MKADTAYFHCGDQLRKTLAVEIDEALSVIAAIRWVDAFHYSDNGSKYEHQTGYNRAFSVETSRSYALIRSLSAIFARAWSSLKSNLAIALRYIAVITSSSTA